MDLLNKFGEGEAVMGPNRKEAPTSVNPYIDIFQTRNNLQASQYFRTPSDRAWPMNLNIRNCFHLFTKRQVPHHLVPSQLETTALSCGSYHGLTS